MKKIVFAYMLNLCFMTSCAQESNQKQANQSYTWIPFLTKNQEYIYVNQHLEKQLNASYKYASYFVSSGYAIVRDDQYRDAVIDSKGNLIVDYTEETIRLETVNNLTLMLKTLEYDKDMPFWKWEWNIMGGGIKKNQRYKTIEIRVLETNQVLVSKDIPYDEEYYNLNVHILDELHLVLNSTLYQLKKKKFIKLKSNIEMTLDKGRYIPYSENKYSIYSVNTSKPILTNLMAVDQIELTVNNQPFTFDTINQERYVSVIPKLLKDHKQNKVYPYPQYDKAFPNAIHHATAEQLTFLQDVSVIYSVNHSPYFILGRFNYDHAVWSYDWLYLNEKGHLLTEIKVDDFYILNQIGQIVWPDKNKFIPQEKLNDDEVVNSLRKVYQTDHLFIVTIKTKQDCKKEGLWNTATQDWEIIPQFYRIDVLEASKHIYAINKDKNASVILYNTKTKQQIGTQSYDYIQRDGFVRLKTTDNHDINFYIDLQTGKEYRE